MRPEEHEYREGRFEEIVASDRARARVLAHVSFIADPSDAVAPADVEAARLYLRRCMERMSYGELLQKSECELAALWARGALGASRYRQRDPQSSRGRRPRERDL